MLFLKSSIRKLLQGEGGIKKSNAFEFQIVTYRVDDAHSGYIADVRYEGEAQPYQHPPGYVPFTVHTVQPKSGKMNPIRSGGSDRDGHWTPNFESIM